MKTPPVIEKPRWFDRAMGLAPIVLTLIFATIVVHLTSLLLLPHFYPYRSFARLTRMIGTAPQPFLLESGRPEKRLFAFDDPFAAEAVCLFDLRGGPMVIKAQADGEHVLSVSGQSEASVIFYGATDRQIPGRRLNLVLATVAQAQKREDERGDAPQSDTELTVIPPSSRGFFIFRTLAADQEGVPAARAALSSIICAKDEAHPGQGETDHTSAKTAH